ncbi:hypothetical protein [Clostridium paridis]|uniref:Uncharacterized protein n=1 Tax=Clostridium paridis TaxID=2803863 RepID=A0A937FIK5_9CLOT|nr:hypothetical protein [Clostridium paridis]MBL4934129.1 hypothetical protein [Clostridium paridis]
MSKFMSVLEKLNVIEKVDNEASIDFKSSIENIENHNNDAEIDGGVENMVLEMDENVPSEVTNYEGSLENISESTTNASNETIDKNFIVDDIYSMYSINSSNSNTIFTLGKFIDAIPESLPSDVRKESVINIINAANSNLNDLLNDGKTRLDVLNKFSEKYQKTINTSIAEYKAEIDKLKDLISSYENQIKSKETMLDEQNNIIKFETQKLTNIFNFFK